MRWHIKRTKLLFALIPIISIAFYVLTANNDIYADQSFTEFDIYRLISTTAKPQEGKNSPLDYSAAENFAIAADVYLNTDSVQSTTNGTVTAMGFYKQTVLNYRSKRGGHIFSESVSLSAIASVAEQRYFKDGALLYRKGEASGGAVKSWSDSVTELSNSVYRQRYGVVPQEITKYSVTNESVQSGSFVSQNSDGTFTFELVMHASEAQKYSRYEMMTFAGVTAYPEFLACRLVYTIDSNWVVREIKSYDTYKIDIMGGTKCESSLTETYSYEKDFMPERAQIFADYVPTGSTGDVSTEKGPSDYLNEAFGAYISGSEVLKLSATLKAFGRTYPVRAQIDIAGGNYGFAVGDDIFATYKNDSLFLALGNNKYSLSVSDLSALGLNLSGFEFGDDFLATLFENHTITETDTHVHIRMPFELMGIALDVDMGLKKADDGSVTADTIDAEIMLDAVKMTVSVNVDSSVTLPELNESEYLPLKPLLDAVANTIAMPAYKISGNLSVDANGTPVNVNNLLLRIAKANESAAGITADGSLSIFGIDANLWFNGETAFVKAGNAAIRANVNELGALADSLSSLIPNANLPSFDAQSIIKLLPSVLPGGLNLDTAFALLKSINYNGSEFNLQVKPLIGPEWSVVLTHGNMLETLSIKGLKVDGIELNAELKLEKGEIADGETVGTPENPQSFLDASEIASLLPEIKKLASSKSFSLKLGECSVTAGTTRIELTNGELTLNTNPLALEASFSVKLPQIGEIPLKAMYLSGADGSLKNGVAYIVCGNFAASVNIADAEKVLSEQFGTLMPENGKTVLNLLSSLGLSLDALNLNSILNGLNLSYSSESGTGKELIASLTLSETIAAQIKLGNGAIEANLNAYLPEKNLKANIQATVTGSEYAEKIQPESILPEGGEFINLAAFAKFIAPIKNAVSAKAFTVRIEGALEKDESREEFAADIRLKFENGKFVLGGTAYLSEQAINFALENGIIYLSAGNVKLKLAATDAGTILRELNKVLSSAGGFVNKIPEVLSSDDAARLAAILGADAQDKITALAGSDSFAKIISLLGTAENMLNELLPVLDMPFGLEMVKALLDLSFLQSVVPEHDFNGITTLLAGIRVDENGSLIIPVVPANGSPYSLTLSANETAITGMSLQNMQVAGLGIELDAQIAYGAQNVGGISSAEAETYLDLMNVAELLPNLSNLLSSNAFELKITDGTIKSSLISGELSGTIRLSLSPLSLSAELKFKQHTAYLLYSDGTAYLSLNDPERNNGGAVNTAGGIKLSFTLDDVASLKAEIERLTKAAGGSEEAALAVGAIAEHSANTVSLLEKALGGKTLADLLGYVAVLKQSEATDEAGNTVKISGITAGISAGDFSLSARLAGEADGLDVNAYNFNYAGSIEGALNLALRPVSDEAHFAAIADEVKNAKNGGYVSLALLQSYIEPALNTLNRHYYRLNFEGNVRGNSGNTTISGELNIERTEGFLNAYVKILLDGKTGEQSIELYLIDHTDYTPSIDEFGNSVVPKFDITKLEAHVNYNKLYVKVNFKAVAGIIGSLCDILNLDIPMLNDLTDSVGYEHIQTDVFKTMEIAGLDSIRETINSLFGVAENVQDATNEENGGISGLTGFITEELIDKVLGGISLGFDENSYLQIKIDNGIFGLSTSGKIASVTVAHANGELSYLEISNLIANGDTVYFRADLDAFEKGETLESGAPAYNKIVPPDGAMDLSSIDTLLYSIIKTADLREFNITGTLNLKVLTIDANIDIDAKVKILDDGSTVAAIKLAVPRVSLVVELVQKSDSYIYFANNMLYFVVDKYERKYDWKAVKYYYELVGTDVSTATVDEFLANPTYYLFKLILMSDTIKDQIMSSVSGGGSGGAQTKDLSKILKNYSFNSDNGRFSLVLGLAELAGSSSLGDLNLYVDTSKNNYITGLELNTKLAGLVTLSLNNTTLENLIREPDGTVSGKRTLDPHYTTDGTTYPYRVYFGGKAGWADDSRLTHDLSRLEDDLAILFPVEAAQTFAEKAQQKAEKANKSVTSLTELNGKITELEQNLRNAEQANAEARQKLNEANAQWETTGKKPFGYDLLSKQAAQATKNAEKAREELLSAENKRVSAAESTVELAADSYRYAVKAADSAEKALAYESSVRAYSAAGNAAMAAVSAIEASKAAATATIKAAEAAGENGADALKTAQDFIADMNGTVKETAAKASLAASTACAKSVAEAERAANNAESAAAAGNMLDAAIYAGEALNAIGAMSTTSEAANRAAKISENETALLKAQENAELVAQTKQSTALKAGNAAVLSAESIAASGNAASQNALEYAEQGNADGSLTAIAEALEYADAANTAASGAAKAVEILTETSYADSNEQTAALANRAKQAAAQAKAASENIGTNVLDASIRSIAVYAAQVNSTACQNAESVNSLTSTLNNALSLTAHALTAKQYNPTAENVAKLQSVYAGGADAAVAALEKSSGVLFEISQTYATTGNTASVILNTQYGKDKRNEVKSAAENLSAYANNVKSAANAATELMNAATALCSKALPSLSEADAANLKATLAESLGNAGDENGNGASGLMGASGYLATSSNNAGSAATHLTNAAANLDMGFLNWYKSDVEKAQAAAQTAVTDCSNAGSAVGNMSGALDSLLALL